MLIKHNVRWEVRFEYVSDAIKHSGIVASSTRKVGRMQLRVYKGHPDFYKNVRMYRVSEFLDENGNPTMTFHRRAR
ncbi:MAG: hypothetical protein ACRC6V_09480 [Bacteroidales bacterium]